MTFHIASQRAISAIAGFFCVSTIALALTLWFAGTAGASSKQLSIFQDDGRLLSPNLEIRDDALDKIQALGPDVVKVNIAWRSASPNAESNSRPGGDTTSPDYYNWGTSPAVIDEIRAHGMTPWIMVTQVGPDWASSSAATKSQPGGYKPSPELFGDFALAVSKRFPDVKYLQLGNEPNFQLWLWPQITTQKVSVAASHYRKMYVNAQDKILSAGLAGRELLFGALAPRANKPTDGQRATQPVRFLRDFFCLDDRLKPLRGAAARLRDCVGAFPRIKATAFAYHPYTTRNGPRERPASPDDAPIAYMSRIYRVLDKAYAHKRMTKRKIPVYNDEFAYESNPPDGIRTPVRLIPEYINESEYLSWIDPRMRSYAQYQLYDEPVENVGPGEIVPQAPGFQAGLLFFDGSVKGNVQNAYRLPIVVIKTRSGNRVTVWFGVRHARYLSPASATLQFRKTKNSSWKPVSTTLLAAGERYKQVNVTKAGAGRGEFRIVVGSHSSRTASAVEPLRALK